MLDKQRKEWDDKMSERALKEVAFLKERFNRVERNENELNTMIVQNAEDFNDKKVQYETDVQILEQKLQQMKAIFQLNQEKLEYNYQVLHKRDEENNKTKANQKRKITKLNDLTASLKKKFVEQLKQFEDENQQLSDDYKRVTDMFNDLKLKSKHFLAVDLKKFHDIWKMNEDHCKLLAHNLLEADRIIHEQQLGLAWMAPDISFMNNVGPIQDSDKTKSGKEFVNEIFTSDNEDEAVIEERYENEDEQDEAYFNEELSNNQDDEHSNSQQQQQPKGSTATNELSLNQEAKTSVKFRKETSQFREDSHKVILNLSKYTLRNIVMLICDEAVSF